MSGPSLSGPQIARACVLALLGIGVAWSSDELSSELRDAVNSFARLHAGSSRASEYLAGRFLALVLRRGLLRLDQIRALTLRPPS